MAAALAMVVTVAGALGAASWSGVGPFAIAGKATPTAQSVTRVLGAPAEVVANSDAIGSPDLHMSFTLAAPPTTGALEKSQ